MNADLTVQREGGLRLVAALVDDMREDAPIRVDAREEGPERNEGGDSWLRQREKRRCSRRSRQCYEDGDETQA